MRILIAYPGPTHSTFDVAAGYEKALRSLGHDVHGYVYHQYLHFYTKALEHWQTHNTEYEPSAEDAPFYASQHLIPAAIDFEPDVVLIVSGSALHRRAYDLLHKLGVPVVLLLTESPYEDFVQAKFIEQGHAVHAFTNERMSVERLSETGVPITYLPHSFDPDVHKPIDLSAAWRAGRAGEWQTGTNGDHRSDVFFHGTLWPERARLFDSLKSLPLDVRFSGIDVRFSLADDAKPERGDVLMDNAEMAKMYNGAKICLNHHRTFKREPGDHIGLADATSIGPRAYEIAACGAFQLCDDTRPELREVFGESVPTYHDADDLRARIEHFIDRPAERKALADLARRRVQNCTFEDRAREVVEPVLRRL